MASTRADLRLAIRQDLESWPVVAELEQEIDSKAGTLRITDGDLRSFAGAKSLLEIDSEVLRVISVPKNGNSLRVQRAWKGTTAASHLAGATVKIYESWGWTDVELNRLLKQAYTWLKPHAWVPGITADFTWSSGDYEVTIPASANVWSPGGNIPYQLEYKDSEGEYHPFHGWRMIGTKLRFRNAASTDRTLRLRYYLYQEELTTETATLDSEDFFEAIVKYTVHLALNSLKSNRVRFAEYSAALNDRSSTPDELIRMAFDFKNQAVLAREEKSMPKPSGFASTYREEG